MWKDCDSTNQLLGFSFIDGLHDDTMFDSLVSKIQQKNRQWNRYQVLLHGKVVIANHLVASSLWYILTLVTMNSRRIHQLQQFLVAFIWSKEGRASRNKCPERLLTLGKKLRGLGLVDVVL